MLDAIRSVRLTLKLQGKCCTDLEVTPLMLRLFTNAMYVLMKMTWKAYHLSFKSNKWSEILF